jgi:hypothetical protein
MIIKLAKELITDILSELGVKQVFTEEADLERIKSNPTAVILAHKEKLDERRRKVAKWTDDSGQKFIRYQMFQRMLPLEINLFHSTEEAVDQILVNLLTRLPKGMYDGKGNWVEIAPSGIEWPPEQKNRSLGVLFILFVGGIYRDQPLATIEEVNINQTIAH